jgi:hypothetical protein
MTLSINSSGIISNMELLMMGKKGELLGELCSSRFPILIFGGGNND